MNKREAKELAHRITSGLLEEFMGDREPLTYDYPAGGEEHESKRLSEKDHRRVEEALGEILDKHYEAGDDFWASVRERNRRRKVAKPDGKPGHRWKKHDAREKRWRKA